MKDQIYFFQTFYAVPLKENELKDSLNALSKLMKSNHLVLSVEVFQDLIHPRIFTFSANFESKVQYEKFIHGKQYTEFFQNGQELFFEEEKIQNRICKKLF